MNTLQKLILSTVLTVAIIVPISKMKRQALSGLMACPKSCSWQGAELALEGTSLIPKPVVLPLHGGLS